MARQVVLLSGGLDSAVLLAARRQASTTPSDTLAFAVDYGQRHHAELISAAAIAEYYNIELTTLHLSQVLRPVFAESSSSQVGLSIPVPDGHYTSEQMKDTIVPNRNMLLIALAGAFADSTGCSSVAYAAHSGDHAIYPDCRPAFAESCATTLELATGVKLIRPFIDKTKADIVALGASLKVPFHLTYSCYKGRYHTHCGTCGTCYERREAFTLANVPDPTRYEDGA